MTTLRLGQDALNDGLHRVCYSPGSPRSQPGRPGSISGHTEGRLVESQQTVPAAGCWRGIRVVLCLCAVLLVAGCASPLRPAAFASTAPAFDPVTFWTGRTASWGVVENRDGAPTAIVTTTTAATAEGADELRMVQHVMTGGNDTLRVWRMRRLGGGQFEATANDMVGTARGFASGRTFHWTWKLASKPGNVLYNVKMEQWMYLSDDGTLMIRTIITKLGVRLAEVSEQFVRRE